MAKTWIILAALLGGAAVALGAFHAHGLEEKLVDIFESMDGNLEPIQQSDTRYREKFDENKNKILEEPEIETYVDEQMHNCEVGVRYQMYHALALLAIGILSARRCTWLLCLSAVAMLLGVIGFSGGLYFMAFDFLVLDLPELHWAVVPVGGGLMILGWALLALAAFFVPVDDV